MKNKIHSLIIILFISSFFSQMFAQNDAFPKLSIKETDSLMAHYWAQEDLETALSYVIASYEKAKKIYGPNDSITSHKISKVGIIYYYLGDLDEAEKYYILSKNIRAKAYGKEHRHYSNSLVNLAWVYEDKGEIEKAIVLYKEAVRIAKNVYGEKDPRYANTLNDLASAYYNINDLEEAEPLIAKSMAIRKKALGENDPDYASSLNNLAALYWKMNNFAGAEPLYKQALTIKEAEFGKFSSKYASSLNNLGVLYTSMEQYNKAEAMYLQVKIIYEKTIGKEHFDYAMLLDNLADLYMEQDQYEKAKIFYLEALSIRKKVFGEDSPDYASSLNSLGTLYRDTKEYEQAEKLFLKAIPVLKATMGDNNPDHINSLNDIGNLYIKMNRLEDAEKYFNQAILSNSKTGDSSIIKKLYKLDAHEFNNNGSVVLSLKGFHSLGKVHFQKTGDFKSIKKGFIAIETAMRINELSRNDLNNEEDKLRLLSDMSDLAYLGIETGMKLSKHKKKELYLQKMFQFAEQNKSILLADALQNQRAKTMGNLPDSLALLEAEYKEYKDVLKKANTEAESEEEKEEIRSELNGLNAEIAAFLKKIKKEYPEYYKLKYQDITAKAFDIQELLNPGELLIEYFVADSSTYIFSISKNNIDVQQIVMKKSKLKTKTQKLRKALSNYKFILQQEDLAHASYTANAHWFYKEMVLPALQKHQGTQKLIIIPDFELGHLPFEVFLTEIALQGQDYKDLKYLLHDFQISYNYSATIWKKNREAPSQTTNHKILACAADYSIKTDTNLVSNRGLYAMNLRNSLQPLPAAAEEIATLSNLFVGDFMMGNECTESFFKKNAADYGVIHLAMHGTLHDRVPILSSMALTEDQDSLEDNFLQAYEISRLHLQAKLVVLSACETGYGKFEQGEGVMSLARSFMYAGTPSLVVSLWQVNDQSTAHIMQLFYQYLAEGMTKDQALQQAKLDYINAAEGVAAHPAFWSAFIQLGNPQPIQIQTKSILTLKNIGGGLGVVVLLGALFFFKKRKKKAVA